MKIRFGSLTTLALVCLSAISARPDAAGAPSVDIVLDPRHPGPAIADGFSGLSFESSLLWPNENGIRYFRPDNAPLITLFHTLGIRHLRIGGNTSDRNARRLAEEADLDSLFQFARAADVKVLYCLRLHNGDPRTDAGMAKYILSRYAAQVDCFSIGQEPSAYPAGNTDLRPNNERMGPANEKYQYPAYAADWKKFADAIIAAAPEVKFTGPGVHNNGAWARKFMADFGRSNHVVLITEHLYPGGAGDKVRTPEIGRDRMLAAESGLTNGFPGVYKKLYDSFVPQAAAMGLPCRLEEVNNYFNGGATNVSNTFAAALWGLDFMYWWAAHGLAGMDFHTGDRVAAGAELRPSKYTAFFSTPAGYTIRPLGYGIKAFDLGSHGALVPVVISNPSRVNLSAYGVLEDGGNLYCTIINKEHAPGASATKIVLSREGGNCKNAQAIFLTAPQNDVSATTGQTLGGAQIGEDGGWHGTWQRIAPSAAGGPIALELPPASAVILKMW